MPARQHPMRWPRAARAGLQSACLQLHRAGCPGRGTAGRPLRLGL